MYKERQVQESEPVGECDGLLDKAARCRRLATSIADRQTVEALTALANEYEQEAAALAAAGR